MNHSSPPQSRKGFLKLAGFKAAAAATVGALGLDATRPTIAAATTGPTGLPVYNVQTYGATGNGTTDDTNAINSAIADAATAGGGVVYLPAGAYLVSPFSHPQNSSYAVCILMRSHVILQGAGMGASTIRLVNGATLPGGSNQINLLLNATIAPVALASRDQQMVVQDLTIDGSAANQSAYANGVVFIRCRDVYHERVRVQNVYGTGTSGGVAETFFFEFQLGAESYYHACEAVTTDGSNTSTGFSADGATGITYDGCLARNMKVGNGFTHNGCALVRYADCHSYTNGGYGFNSEVSEDVRYANCVAGGRADAGGQGPFSANQSLGNTSAGFVVSASTVVDFTGCAGRYNGSHGLWVANNPDSVRVTGGNTRTIADGASRLNRGRRTSWSRMRPAWSAIRRVRCKRRPTLTRRLPFSTTPDGRRRPPRR